MPDREILYCPDAVAWGDWLRAHHADSSGVRLAIAKKDSGAPGPTYAEALDEALCWGWVDAVKASLDERYFLQTFTPRAARSIWSQRNREHVTRLTEEGRMRPPGLAEVERAKADGRWDAAYAGSRTAEVPPDLQAALDASPTAAAFFASLDSANRYAMVFRIGNVKRAETRQRKIAEYVGMLERGETLHPVRRRRSAET